jgi:GNAT superfamily N-acetyltransferase
MSLVRALAEYERLTDRCTATPADLDRMLFAPSPVAWALLAEVPDREPVGLALYLYVISTFEGKIGLFLEDLFVEPDMRGRGIGLGLLRHLARLAKERGHHVIEWNVLNWNEPSIRFYEQLGATRVTEWQTRRLTGSALTALAEGALTDG